MSESAELKRLREICLALPDTSERLSHGTPHFFAGKRNFVAYWNNHHEDGRHCLWCAAPKARSGCWSRPTRSTSSCRPT
jgi:hypothetical protein